MTILNLNGSVFSGLTTSGAYDFTVTRDDIITLAMKFCGKLGDGMVPSPEEMSDGSMFLNMMVKQWMGKQDFSPGLKMWTRQRGVLFLSTNQFRYQLGPTGDHWTTEDYFQTATTAQSLVASQTLTVSSTADVGTNDYVGVVDATGNLFWSRVTSFTPTTIVIQDPLTSAVSSGAIVFTYAEKQQRPLEIATVLLRDINASDTPINKMTLEQYEALPSKTMTTFLSDPAAVYYESQLGNGVLYLDVGGAQDVTKHLHIVFLRAIQNLNNPADVPEYSQEWYLALTLGLAKILAPMFNVVWTKEAEDSYKEALAIAREAPAETTALYFQPYADTDWYQ